MIHTHYRGWNIEEHPGAFVLGRFRAERNGEHAFASSLESIKRIIDNRMKDENEDKRMRDRGEK